MEHTGNGETSKEAMKKSKTPLVVTNLSIVSPNRQNKDIGDLKIATVSADSIDYPNRVLLYDTYHHILTFDGHLNGVIGKRISFVRNKKLHFIDKAGVRVPAMDRVIQSAFFYDVITKICETIFWGVTGLEFYPGNDLRFVEIPRKHIKPEKKILTINQYDDTGIDYEHISNIWVIGEPDDKGALLTCAPYSLYKRTAFADWAQYIELFGHPVRVIYYDAYDVKTKIELREVLDQSGSSLGLMIPKQAKFEMFDGKDSNSSGDLQKRFIDSCNAEMSVAILGNTETTKSGIRSGLAQAEEHGKQQLEIQKDDLEYVCSKLNSPKFKSILKSYGLPVEGGRFVFEKEVDLLALRKRIDIDLTLDKIVPLGDDYWYNTYGIPRPKKLVQTPLKDKLNEDLMGSESYLDMLLIFIKEQFKRLQK